MSDLDLRFEPSNHMKAYLYSYPTECMHGFLTIKQLCLSLYNWIFIFFYFAPSRIDFEKKILPKTDKSGTKKAPQDFLGRQ